jgi:ribosomal protein S12 methylthiotransferase accessory factor
LGLSHLTIHEPRSALPYFDEALKLEPKEEDIPSIYSYMGVAFKNLELYQKSIDALEKAREFDNERTDIHNLMGFCYFKLKKHEKAIECFKKVLQINPASAIDYANIASNFRDMGDKEQAIRYYKLALELDPTIDFARTNLDKLHPKARS